MDTSIDSTRKLPKQLDDLAKNPNAITNEDIKNLMPLYKKSVIRRFLHRRNVEEARGRILKRVLRVADFGFDDKPDCRWGYELTDNWGFVEVLISTEVSQEDALQRLKSIVALLEENPVELPGADMPEEKWTDDFGWVIAFPE